MRVLKIAGAAIVAVIVVAGLLLVDRRALGFPDVGNPGAGRARNRLPADHRGRQQDRDLAVAQRDAERRHAAGSEGPRRLQPRHRRQRAGRRDAGEPVVGPPAGHRTRHQEAGAARAAAARTLGTADLIGQAGAGSRRRRQGRDRPHHGDRRHGGVFQSARPRGKSHRGHQRRSHHRRRPQGQDHRQRQGTAIVRSNSTSTRPRRCRRWSGRTFPSRSCSTRRASCRRRCRPRPRSGSTVRP